MTPNRSRPDANEFPITGEFLPGRQMTINSIADWRNWETWRVDYSYIESLTRLKLFPRTASLSASLMSSAELNSVIEDRPFNNIPIRIDSISEESPFISSNSSPKQISIFKVNTQHFTPSQISSSQISSSQISSTEGTLTSQGNFSQISSSQISKLQIDSSQISSTQVDVSKIDSSQINPAQIDPLKVSLPSSITLQQLLSSHNPNLQNTTVTAWAEFLQSPTQFNLKLEISDLPTGQLAEATITRFDSVGRPTSGTILIDDDANGKGWYIDPTPWDSSEFRTSLSDTAYRATPDSAAYGKYDLLTAIWHEMGHALGFINGYSQFDSHVHNREFVGDGFTAALTRDGSHLDSNSNPYSLMNSSLKPGERKLPSALELEILNAIRSTNLNTIAQTNTLQAPLTSTALTGILNGTFDTTDDWSTRGSSSISQGHAIIAEDPRYNSNFKQTFTVPNGAKYLQFTLLDTNLGNDLLSPGDAFEVALLDSQTNTSLVRTATGLTFSDALLNVQSDGQMYLSSDIIPTGYGSLHSPMTFTVDISHITPGTEATLYFDLLGFGDRDASVIFDNIRLLSDLQTNTSPIAQDDAFSTNQNTSIAINPLANDTATLQFIPCWVSFLMLLAKHSLTSWES
jgi:hypothetical protein